MHLNTGAGYWEWVMKRLYLTDDVITHALTVIIIAEIFTILALLGTYPRV